MKPIGILFMLLSVVVGLTACSDDNENNTNKEGVSNQSWSAGEEMEISDGQDLTVSFTTKGNWIASVTPAGTDWLTLSQKQGGKGSHSLIVSVTGETTTDRTATVTIQADGSLPSSFKVTQKAALNSENMLVNQAVDEYLSEMYLWNDEWKTLTKDFGQDYETFFYDNLYKMNTNTLDKKPYTGSDGKTYYSLFSYIEKKIPVTRSTQIEKELEYSFGFTNMTAVRYTEKNYVLCPQGIYPDSPASEGELKRGAYIYKVDGNLITSDNVNDVFLDLMYPESGKSLGITEWTTDDTGGRWLSKETLTPTATRDLTLNARAMYKNPVLHHEVITADGGQKVGYLVYDNFDAGFDEELFEVFKEFKTEGIQDMILDLRYNGGGHVVTANMIASCVAGSGCQNKVFMKYRYNAERMKKYSDSQLEEKFSYKSYNNLGTGFSLSAGDLSLPRLYCLVGNNSASASELVINALRGIDVQVILIGERTHGKNVGMELTEKEINGETYRIVPITFQSYNAKGFGDYENGFEPTVELDETDADGDGYFDDYLPYGDRNEPLLARALQEITGVEAVKTRSAARSDIRRRTVGHLPALRRHGHEGMIKIAGSN